MLSLLVLILFGIIVGVFAVQNTQVTSVVFGPYGLQNIPLYGVILGAMLFGIFVSWLISLGGLVSNALHLRGKENKLREAENHIHQLENKNHELELENAQLRGDETHAVIHNDADDQSRPLVNPFVKLRQRFS